MELKKQKDSSGEEYTWTDFMSLQFTQNVRQASILTYKSTEKAISFPLFSFLFLVMTLLTLNNDLV